MKYFITESQNDIIREKIKKSVEEIGFLPTINKFKLSFKQINYLLSDEYFPEISCDDLYEFIVLLFRTKKVKTEYQVDKYVINLDYDDRVGSLHFQVYDETNDDIMYGHGTPYYEGLCSLPLEISYYTSYDNDEKRYIDYDLEQDYFETVKLPTEFSSFYEIISWFENGYISLLVEYIDSTYTLVRNEIS
jgi:hypothetical protein